MRRRPNPWIAVPALVLGGLAGWLGWLVTDLSCRARDASGAVTSCPAWSAVMSIAAFVLVVIGVSLVMVLVYRSLAEWRDRGEGNQGQH